MTPSINRLEASAKALGEYVIQSEFELVKAAFADERTGPMDFEQFTEWVKNDQYYDALVCVNAGQIVPILTQLRADYDQLTALCGYDIEVEEERVEPSQDEEETLSFRQAFRQMVKELFNI